jgi:ABC-2 type transport system permease protein
MNSQSDAAPEFPLNSQRITPLAMSATRPMYWSVRRELWENRSIYIAPLTVAGVYLFAFLISLFWVPRSVRGMAAGHGAMPPVVVLAMPYSHADMLLSLIAFIVGIFFSLDALHSERRDRSILFWKSLPVSDLTTVLSKASIPLVVLPLFAFAVTVTVQLIMLLLNAAVLLVSHASTATPWAPPLFEMDLVALYGTAVLALWHAPIYCWFLLVSGWARRATFLWAVLPLVAISAIEYIAFHTSYLGSLLHDRLFGFVTAAFDVKDKNGVPIDPHFIPLTQLAPERFLSSPDLWIGLVFAALCLVAAVRLRRYQGPI